MRDGLGWRRGARQLDLMIIRSARHASLRGVQRGVDARPQNLEFAREARVLLGRRGELPRRLVSLGAQLGDLDRRVAITRERAAHGHAVVVGILEELA